MAIAAISVVRMLARKKKMTIDASRLPRMRCSSSELMELLREDRLVVDDVQRACPTAVRP